MLDWYRLYFYIVSFFLLFMSIFFILLYINIPEKILKRKYKISDVKKTYGYYPYVLFLVPAYNEEKVIEKTIRSISSIEYPQDRYTILVIDDGSTDRTFEIAKGLEKEIKNLKVIKKKNGGKASAINFGLKYAIEKNIPFEYFAIIDADTYIPKDYLSTLVLFKDKRVYAVSVKILPEKPESFVEKIQILEYAISNLTKLIYSYYESWMIANTGTIFRREVIDKVGLFDEEDITEDLEYGLRIMEKGYKIDHAPWVTIYTDVPRTLFSFLKQRIRWFYGWFVNTLKHKGAVLNMKSVIFLSFIFVYYNLVAFFFLVFLTAINSFRELQIWVKIRDILYWLNLQITAAQLFEEIIIKISNSMFWLVFFTTLLAIGFHLASREYSKVKASIAYAYLYLSFYWILLAVAQLNSLINILAGRKKWWK